MNYLLKRTNYNNFDIWEDNKLAPRSYYIPFSNISKLQESDYLHQRYDSDMVTLLNGVWNFQYFSSCRNLPVTLDTSDMHAKKVKVPSCWQFTGDEKYCYLNDKYEFKCIPPRVPKDTPVGVYYREFELDKVTDNELITFLGVMSCIELYVNGEYVGYSEGSHNIAEFNLSKYLVEGSNEIVVLVYKWCTGSYLECQDMFRNNGIFRDVYITHFGKKYINDFRILPKSITHDKYELYLSCDVVGVDYNLRYIIKDGEREVQNVVVNSGEEIRLVLDNITEWSAENPHIYTFIAELIDSNGVVMCASRDFGLNTVAIKDNVLYWNDVDVKLKGVNHHDTNPDTGYYMTNEDYIRDIEQMKRYNVNAIRMSHYPPDPIFISICEHYGMYVVDEADIETHGMMKAGNMKSMGKLSQNKKWKERYWDRVYRMYERDKNSVAIVMWSLGNESGGYLCQDYCYENLKKLTNIPIHYEGVVHTKRFAYDVISEMYPSLEHLREYVKGDLDKKYYEKPYMLCEYAHSMGVGPGALAEYFDLMMSRDSFIGCFVWEWRDHAIHHTKDGCPYEYTYGGDHGEVKHDGNFCVDGLTYPDCTPHTGCKLMGNVYSPLKTYLDHRGKIIIESRYNFSDTSNIDIVCDTYRDGQKISSDKIDMVIQPKQCVQYNHHMLPEGGHDIYMVFSYTDKSSGNVISTDSVILSECDLPNTSSSAVQILNTGYNLRMSFDGGMLTFSLANGCITGYKKNGVQLFNNKPVREDGNSGLIGELYRAPIDNYRNIKGKWQKIGLDKTEYKLVYIEEIEGNRVLTVHDYIAKKKVLARFTTEYQVDTNGTMTVHSEITSDLAKTIDVPKVGLSVEIPKSLHNVEYYGYGDSENYADMCEHTHLGVWEGKAENMFESYIRPQDNGNRSMVRSVKLTDDDGNGMIIKAVNKPFNFTLLPTTLKTLVGAKHIEDLVDQGIINLNIDAFVRGIGSNSCGPDTAEEYKYRLGKNSQMSLDFTITPVMAEK